MDLQYEHDFRNKRVPSLLLQKEEFRNALREEHLVWIRPVRLDWTNTLRRPTLGCMLDVRSYRDINCVHMDSPKGQKLIRNVCFRGKV